MSEELIITTNTLLDIINFLRDKNIVCLHYKQVFRYFYHIDSLNYINGEKLIHIDISCTPSLLDETEWVYYIKREGFVEYKSISILPTNTNKIYHFLL
jgi:hypothetical protein